MVIIRDNFCSFCIEPYNVIAVRAVDKREYLMIILLNSHQKHML